MKRHINNNIIQLLTDINSPPLNGKYYTDEDEANTIFIIIISTMIIMGICSILNCL
jgi:hypothetical protein